MPTRLPRTIFRSLAAACIAASSLTAAQAADIKIGALFPFSGGLALLGDESYRGVQLAVDERNAAGGINGEKVVLVKADAVDANQAVGEARRLTSVENVSAVFGSYSSAVSSAATQVTELAGVPSSNSVRPRTPSRAAASSICIAATRPRRPSRTARWKHSPRSSRRS